MSEFGMDDADPQGATWNLTPQPSCVVPPLGVPFVDTTGYLLPAMGAPAPGYNWNPALAAIDADGMQAMLNGQRSWLTDLFSGLGLDPATGLPSWESALHSPVIQDSPAVLTLDSLAGVSESLAVIADPTSSIEQIDAVRDEWDDRWPVMQLMAGDAAHRATMNSIWSGPSEFHPV